MTCLAIVMWLIFVGTILHALRCNALNDSFVERLDERERFWKDKLDAAMRSDTSGGENGSSE